MNSQPRSMVQDGSNGTHVPEIRNGNEARPTARRYFLGQGAVAVAAGVAALSGREARAHDPHWLPS